MHPTIIESTVIGTSSTGDEMHRWTEQFADGTVRTFEEYETTCPLPSLGRMMGLTLVREVLPA